MANRFAIGIALIVALTVGRSAAASESRIGQGPEPSAPAGGRGDPQAGQPLPTSGPSAVPNAPYAPSYPSGDPALPPGYPASNTYPYSAPYPYQPGDSHLTAPYPVPQPAEMSEAPPELPALLPPGTHTHDGFFFRWQLGLGLGALSVGDTAISYGGFTENLAFGWALSPRIVLYAEMGGLFGVPSGSSPYGDFAVMATYSLRATYYLPSNLFFGGGAGGGLMDIGGSKGKDSNARNSKMGLALRSEFGQEYWVSANWALGWALNLSFALAQDRDVSADTWTGIGLTAVFSATYN
jgi:hypothetical protein